MYNAKLFLEVLLRTTIAAQIKTGSFGFFTSQNAL